MATTPDQTWKRGDTLPAVAWTLNLPPGMDLTTATGVEQHMRHTVSNTVISRTVTVTSAATNEILYEPISGDMNVSGDYDVEFEVTDAAGVYTVPNDPNKSFYLYRVIPDLA